MVSYVPLGNGEFVLTSNRDESPARSLNRITRSSENNQELIYPKDIKGGTWICASSQNRLVCLLNGAFIKHRHQPPYPKSRGIIVKNVFAFANIHDFYTQYDLRGIEPFTMVVWDAGQLYQLRRDEQETYLTPLNPNAFYIWSSSTLYDGAAKRKRQFWFDTWKRKGDISPSSILNLHHTGGDGDIANDYVMNRDGVVCTVSITQVTSKKQSLSMTYHNLLSQEISQATTFSH